MGARVTPFLVRNWPLRLAAIALATVLYTGLVLSQNARLWPGPLQIQAINRPAGAFLLDDLPPVTQIRFLAPVEVAGRITNADFRAIADLANVEVQPGGPPVPVPVTVQALSGRIQVTDWFPRTINVRLDPVTTRIVPVTVDHGTIPAGLVVADPETDVGTATVRGASSLVARVREARAQVSLDPNGINVDADVNLIPVDERGEVVAPVDIEPQIVHVRVEIGRENPTRPIPVVAQLVGDPASGYRVIAIEVTPLTVTVQGDPGLLGDLQSVTTEPVGVGGRTDDLDTDVELLLPEGVVVVDDPTVRVRVDLEPERGSRSFETGLTLTGAEPDRIYRLSTPAVVVTLGGTGAALQALDAATLSATVDVRRLDEGTDTVPIEFEPPEGTTLVAISPEEVGIVIEEAPRPSAEPQGSSLPGLPVLPSPAQ